MADFAAPSFSLGLDLDVDPDDLSTEEEREEGYGRPLQEGPEGERSPLPRASSSGRRRFLQEGYAYDEEEEGDCPMEAPEGDPPASTPALKRLKRGPPPARPPPTGEPSTPGDAIAGEFAALDDDIEEFSSQEDPVVRDEYSSRHIHTACSSSKFSLHGQRILATLSARKLKAPKVTPDSKVSISTSVEASSNKKVFPRLTTSPLKRIQLLDSDSEDLSISEGRCEDFKGADACPKVNVFSSAKCLSKSEHKKPEMTSVKLHTDSLWKDFSPKMSINSATPALNEFCEEYFKSSKSPNVDQWLKQHTSVTRQEVVQDDFDGAECYPQTSCISNSTEHDWNLPDQQPPSYQYFYNQDVRIQKLVQQRLPNFVPLGDMKCVRNQQQNAAALDYMSQFGQRNVPCQVHGVNEKANDGGSNSRLRNRKNTKGKEVEEASRTGVTQKSCSAIPKDAGKRRVHADGHSCGHWFTGQDGRKVYVTKDGQELSGRIAYRHYIKEHRGGFRKSEKKTRPASKKKAKR